ncbi:MAG: ABC transporter ATP-binding protein, partial [Firmicutes bacterium]|nr:ABC transporter ATP-binding protein [Bacillota bacterium]
AIPDLDGRSNRLSPIPGLPPDPAALPQGCNFQERCPHCMDICRQEAPGVYVDGDHQIACHLFAKKSEEEA